MEDSNKQNNIQNNNDIQTSDLIALQHMLTEAADPVASLYHEQCIDPVALHFIPESAWTSQNLSLHSLHEDYFGRKNNLNRRFDAIDGGLFHKQGNFTRHGFVILSDSEAKLKVPADQLADVDYHDVLLITHAQQNFTISSTEATISQCKWDNPSGATRVASLRIENIQENQN
ncbi:hypothetical protein GPJ56_009464 [Histomonas meleagridis]|nr:hypothetical protein GPJ56_009464 [Histomonas meleagridis]